MHCLQAVVILGRAAFASEELAACLHPRVPYSLSLSRCQGCCGNELAPTWPSVRQELLVSVNESMPRKKRRLPVQTSSDVVGLRHIAIEACEQSSKERNHSWSCLWSFAARQAAHL